MATIDWTKELTDQLDWHWSRLVRPKLAGLTDAEYRWEPVPGAWNVRPAGEASPATLVGTQAGRCDFEWPNPEPPPFTTISWRMAHLIVGVFGLRAHDHFGFEAGFTGYDDVDFPLTADAGLAALDRTYAAWMTGVRSLDGAGLAAPCGPAEGPYASSPMAALVLHISREAIHHGAEILTLRDLYRTAGEPAGPLVR